MLEEREQVARVAVEELQEEADRTLAAPGESPWYRKIVELLRDESGLGVEGMQTASDQRK
ncbi:hypothetical protein [Streptomyces sp. NPDC014676]|uniref:hypothetical protein n=1 Tax=Streptomyces sp. NPDC014676 TaxID=3364879 RepID=UPI0036F9D9D3